MMSLLCPGHLPAHKWCQYASYKVVIVLSLSASVWCLIYVNWNLPRDREDATTTHGEARFVVDTLGCTIPDIDPFDQTLRGIVFPGTPLVCEGKPALTYTAGRSLKINRTALRESYDDDLERCQYESITRPADRRSDNVYRYMTPVEFTHDVQDVGAEFIRVACFSASGLMIYANFHPLVFSVPEREHRKNEQFHKFKKTQPLHDPFNFLIVGVDSVSRLNFIRQMPETRRYLLDILHAVELKGYNKVADNTFVNLSPMFAGKFIHELPLEELDSDATFDNCPYMWYDAASLGYRTLFAEDAPNIAIFNYEKAGFRAPPADYYLRPFSLAVEEHGSIWNVNHSCVGPKPETQVVLDYVTDFIHLFKDKPTFAFTFITRLTHEGINAAGAADPLYLKFFKDLHASGRLKNTVMLFYSDHGMRFGPIRETHIGQLEERLPFLLLLLPPSFREKHPQAIVSLKLNARRLTTPFDIYETLSGLLTFRGVIPSNSLEQRGMNLLAAIPAERSCDSASIHAHWCTCHKQEVVDPRSDIIQVAALIAIDEINNMMSTSHGTVCASLVLDAVISGRRIIPNTNMAPYKTKLHDFLNNVRLATDKSTVEYVVVFRTNPGGALFEANIQKSDSEKTVKVHGDISRINAYGDQSLCIQYYHHKKFCFCN